MNPAESMKSIIVHEKVLLERSRNQLRYRRLNWQVVTKGLIYQEFANLAVQARTADFPYSLYVQEHDSPNEATIQLSAGQNITGAVNRVTDFITGLHQDTPVIEKGCSLVASQSVNGFIHFILYPYSSERLKPNNENTILFRPLDPNEVTPRIVRIALRRYLLTLRSSSIYGEFKTLSYRERLLLLWMRFQDIRTKTEITRSLLSLNSEWGKVLVAALLTALVTYLLTTHGIK